MLFAYMHQGRPMVSVMIYYEFHVKEEEICKSFCKNKKLCVIWLFSVLQDWTAGVATKLVPQWTITFHGFFIKKKKK